MSQRVLIHDEDAITLALLSNALLNAGYEVQGVEEIESAFDEARRFKPALMIVATDLSGATAAGCLKEIRDSPELGRIPIIFLSARGDVQCREMVRQCGAAAYLSKPICVQDLITEIRRQLNPGAHAMYIM